MYPYSVAQWLLFFFSYCFLGWCFESTYVSLKKRHPVNRGFMYGPFLPIYGCGAIMMLVVSAPFRDNLVATYFAGMIGATALEYVTGVLMEALFKVRYWDYSNQKFQFQGHICLSSSLAWGFFTILMTRVIHKPIERLILSIPDVAANVIAAVIGVIVLYDFIMSFKAALNLRDILVRTEKFKTEISHLKKRLDVMIAVADQERGMMAYKVSSKVEAMQKSIEEALAGLKERVTELSEEEQKEVGEVENAYADQLEKHSRLNQLKSYWMRSVLYRNPDMSSGKFKESMEELKNATIRWRRKK